jgi:hypothetical protein
MRRSKDQFDPAAFAVVAPRTFEDLKVGDVEYARRHGHIAPVVHGLHWRSPIWPRAATPAR